MSQPESKRKTPAEWASRIVNGDSFKLVYEDIVETIRLAMTEVEQEHMKAIHDLDNQRIALAKKLETEKNEFSILLEIDEILNNPSANIDDIRQFTNEIGWACDILRNKS